MRLLWIIHNSAQNVSALKEEKEEVVELQHLLELVDIVSWNAQKGLILMPAHVKLIIEPIFEKWAPYFDTGGTLSKRSRKIT